MNERMDPPSGNGLRTIDKIRSVLHNMIDKGNFETAVLMSADCLPMATAPADLQGDKASMLIAFLRRVCQEAEDKLNMAKIDEIAIRDAHQSRLVCRRFHVDGREMILATIVPPNQAYRRATNQAIKEISKLLISA